MAILSTAFHRETLVKTKLDECVDLTLAGCPHLSWKKLSGNNFLSWYRNLRIVLTQERKLYVLEQSLRAPPPDDAPKQRKMLIAKLIEGSPVGPHVLNMIGYMETLRLLGFPLGQELATNLILQSLPSNYSQFVMNYNMNDYNKLLPELLSMLRTAEQEISKGTLVEMVQGTKNRGKGKKQGKKAKGAFKCDLVALKPKAKVANDDYCFHYCNSGHWKRNCKVYLEELKKKKKGSETSTSGIHVVEINVYTASTSWVLDTECSAHICGNVQDLRNSRSLAKGEVDLRAGNRARVVALTVGTYHLYLPTGLGYALQTGVFILNNTPSKLVEKTPYEIWYGKHPNMSFLKIWGCETYVNRLSSNKLGPKSDKCYFVGYLKETPGYYFYNPIEGKVFVARTVVTHEPRRSGRIRHEPERYRFLVTQDNDVLLVDNDEPTTYAEAMDVKTVFMNGKFLEDVYMTQPEGFVDPQCTGRVCKLQRSIYGLKQTFRSWNLRFDDVVKEFGFIKNEDEPCVYKKDLGEATYVLGEEELVVRGYIDAIFQSDKDDS
ncbi:hypothetical protein CRG98_038823 [Punica granatum]|uniref:Uncharacterized protein n=1 Tax=Punica granatum TaxID=22663 RepID=A0A2I0IA05_PUNGR|nr:hypothetical protein CRG98_038823 [Punica granatum]